MYMYVYIYISQKANRDIEKEVPRKNGKDHRINIELLPAYDSVPSAKLKETWDK